MTDQLQWDLNVIGKLHTTDFISSKLMIIITLYFYYLMSAKLAFFSWLTHPNFHRQLYIKHNSSNSNCTINANLVLIQDAKLITYTMFQYWEKQRLYGTINYQSKYYFIADVIIN